MTKTMLAPAAAAILAGAIGALPAGTARAQDGPTLEWEALTELQMDSTVSSTDPAAELTDVYTTLEGGALLHVLPWLRFGAHATFEPVEDPTDDRFMEDLGLYLDEAFVEADALGASFRAGKIHPDFGFAWDLAPGIYGVDFAEDYEVAEQIGVGTAIPLGELPGGEVALSASIFFADTTVLSESLFTNRGRLRKSDGGAGNTESLESFALALTGGAGEGTTWSVGMRRLAAGQGDPEDEWGFVAGAIHEQPLTEDVTLLVMGEGVYLSHAGGGLDDARYLTVGGGVAWGDWGVTATYALRDFDHAPTDHLGTVSLDYAVTEEATLSAAYRLGREGSETSHTIGLLLSAEFGGEI